MTEESFELAVEDFIKAQQSAVLEIADQGLVSLAQLVETRAIDVAPSFQRRDRWDASKQSLLIESFLVNIPVPPVYLAEDAAQLGSYAVIDGKQRLTAIALFFSDRLVLRGLTRLEKLNGLKYSQLPTEIRIPLGMKNLRITTLLRQSNEDLKHEVFLRLNTGGEVLNAQEIRNVAYRGPLNDLIYRLAENKFLRKQFKVEPPNSQAYRQMADAEYVLRFLTLVSGWRKFKGGLREELDRFMLLNRFLDESKISEFDTRFTRTITTAEAMWASHAFKRGNRDQSLAGLYDAQMLALDQFSDSEHAVLIRKRTEAVKRCEALFDDPEFDEAVRRGTNTPQRLVYRVENTIAALRSVVQEA